MSLTAKKSLSNIAIGVALPCALWLAPFASQASGYKMVVLNDAMPETSVQTPESADTIAARINRCVELTKAAGKAQTDESRSVCHQAVTQARYDARQLGTDGRTLRAYAYTNRGVQRALMQDTAGALADFQTAVELKPDEITQFNLDKLAGSLAAPSL